MFFFFFFVRPAKQALCYCTSVCCGISSWIFRAKRAFWFGELSLKDEEVSKAIVIFFPQISKTSSFHVSVSRLLLWNIKEFDVRISIAFDRLLDCEALAIAVAHPLKNLSWESPPLENWGGGCLGNELK